MMNTKKKSRIRVGISILKIHFLTALILSGALLSNGQENETAQLRKQWEQYTQRILQEKLYAHLDRSFYSAGEIIWFKLYDLDAIQHKPIDISKVAMVELIGKDGKAVMQAKISMKNGFGNGSLLVPFSLNSGNYLFRAYTNWMKNFPADYYFEKQITILNSQRKPSWDSAANKMTYDIQFFPEGGNLVFGFQSKIGFRNVDQFGRGVDCNGVVVDQKNDTVARFQSLKFGLGQFLFEPVKGETYTAFIRTKDGQLIKKMLPTPFDNGYVLRITEPDTGHLLVSVRSNVTMMAPAVYLFVQGNQVIKAVSQSDLKDGKGEFLLDRKMLSEGISQLTLFNANRQPVCERLFFRKPAHPLNIEIRPGKEEYDLRQKVSLDVQTNDHSGPAAGELSVAVYLQDSLQSPGTMDINGWLWLVSDLRGNIESPDFYLNNSSSDVKEATENLLLTQGWRRYRWEEILNKRQPQLDYVPEYDGQIINARIIERKTGAPVPNTPVYLSIPGEKFRLNIATSNQKGELRFEVKRFYGPGELVLQANGRSDSIYRIDIMSPFSEKFSSRLTTPFDINEKYAAQLVFRSAHAQVENHFLSEKKQQFIQYLAPDSLAFYGNPDKKYFLDDYTRFVTMEEVMREYVAEVRVRKNRDQFQFTVFDAPHNYFFENEPMVLLDGIPVFDINKIIAFDPLKMKKIEIVARRYYLDSVINEGIVSYSTYKGDLGGFQLDPSSIILEWSGLQYEREFFSPVYETKDMADSRVPDFRNLLFWSAHVRTDNSGKLQIPFYTSDLPGKYLVVVEGISAQGMAGHGVSSFTVRKSR